MSTYAQPANPSEAAVGFPNLVVSDLDGELHRRPDRCPCYIWHLGFGGWFYGLMVSGFGTGLGIGAVGFEFTTRAALIILQALLFSLFYLNAFYCDARFTHTQPPLEMLRRI